MGGTATKGFLPVEVVLILCSLFRFCLCLYYLGGDYGIPLKLSSYGLSRAFILAHHFGYYILCPLYGIGSRLHLALDKPLCSFLGTLLPAKHDERGERFESLLTCHLRLGATLGFVWQIYVLKSFSIVTFGDSLLKHNQSKSIHECRLTCIVRPE